LQWLPLVALSRTAALAVHSGVPWAASLAAETPAITAPEVFQTVIAALNLGVLGWMCLLFVKGHLHSDGEVDRLTAAHEVEMNRVVTAHAVVVQRLTAENQRLINEKARIEDQRDDALKLAQAQVPILQNFTAVASNLLPVLQELTRYREASPAPRRRARELNDGH
jgi:hypothetical protein